MLFDDLSEEDGCLTLEAIGAELGVTRERARQIARDALIKCRIGFALEEKLGPKQAAPILEGLRGQPLNRFKEAYRELKDQ
jgi:hypothetical protein